MSAFGIVDVTVGLPLYDLQCIPTSVSSRLPWLRGDPFSAAVPRIYHVFLAVQVCTPDVTVLASTPTSGRTGRGAPVDDESFVGGASFVSGSSFVSQQQPAGGTPQLETTALTRVFVLTYDTLLVADADMGVIVHSLLFKRDVAAFLSVEDSPCWFAVAVTSEALGSDVLFQIPVTHDAGVFHSAMAALLAHHRVPGDGGSGHPRVSSVATVAELRNSVHLRTTTRDERAALLRAASGVGGSGGSRPRIAALLWSQVNSNAPIVKDRLAHAKETFATVDAETKTIAAAAMERDADDACEDALRGTAAATAELASVRRALAVEEARRVALDTQEATVDRLAAETQAADDALGALRNRLLAEEQRWEAVLAVRRSEECEEQEALLALERHQAAARRDAGALTRDADAGRARAEAEASKFSGDAYDAQTAERDAAHARLNRQTAAADALAAASGGGVASRRVRDAAREALRANAALRALLRSLESDAVAEAGTHAALEADADAFAAEAARLFDEGLVAATRLAGLRDRVACGRARLAASAAALRATDEELARRGAERPFYLACRDQLRGASERRTKLEEATRREARERGAERSQLQLRLFEERLRATSLRQRARWEAEEQQQQREEKRTQSGRSTR